MILRIASITALLFCLALYLPIVSVATPYIELDFFRLATEIFSASEFTPALISTLVSTVGSLIIALLLSLLFMGSLLLTPSYQRFVRQLPLLLAIPHLAFAVGFYLLLSPKGWLERLVSALGLSLESSVWVQDSYGLSLALALGIKESWFLCWMIWAQLQQHGVEDQFLLARTLGYKRAQIIWAILLPQLLPRLRWPLVAVTAYSLSSIEMAWVLGPTHPPTLAVLAWNWLLDPAIEQRQLGLALTLILMLLMLALSVFICWLAELTKLGSPSGRRLNLSLGFSPWLLRTLLWGHLLMAGLLLLWAFTHSWFYPDLLPGRWSMRAWGTLELMPLINTLSLAIVAALLAILLVLLVLELGFRSSNWMLLPLLLPVLPLVVGQYHLTLWLGLTPGWSAVLIAHLLWVLPYVYLVLQPAYRRLSVEQLLTARTFGVRGTALFLRLKLPLLTRPICAAFALGFSVSLAQYLPTIFIGAGRIETLTTETLTQFAGGDKRLLAVQTLLLLLVALSAYILAQRLPQLIYPNRKAMH